MKLLEAKIFNKYLINAIYRLKKPNFSYLSLKNNALQVSYQNFRNNDNGEI